MTHPTEKKIRLAILFGGRSCEHEVSVSSARSFMAAIDKDKYTVDLIGIDKGGHWHRAQDPDRLASMRTVEGDGLIPVMLGHSQGAQLTDIGEHSLLATEAARPRPDVVFPLLHGPFGEDGTVQGLLDLAGLPYVGSGIVGSAVGMDKAMMKRAFRAENLPLLDYLVVTREHAITDIEDVRTNARTALGYPMFVKPVSLGSSIGVHRIAGDDDFAGAVIDAAQYDRRVMLERAAPRCREIECAVIGNDTPRASVLGEIVPEAGFYDYDAKYLDGTSKLIIPAPLSTETTLQIQAHALRAFEAVGARGLARVDFFVDAQDETIYLNEINTMPGFTPISMFPQLWAASGIAYPKLIDELIALALQEHASANDIRRAL
ncbi:MAG: D-alanine-D-alanine ligase [Gammaproteobacteria bacterium]|jgi:D-alanine-D-alanine ligase